MLDKMYINEQKKCLQQLMNKYSNDNEAPESVGRK